MPALTRRVTGGGGAGLTSEDGARHQAGAAEIVAVEDAADQFPGGEQAGLEHWQRYGTNPTDLLSLWERTQLERLLAP